MSFTVLQNIIEKGVFFLSSLNNHSSQLKHRNCLSACKTVNLLSLLGLTIMRSPLFIPRHLIKRFLISLWVVSVSARRGVPLSRQDRNSATRPNASRKAAFPFFQAPFDKKVLLIVRKWKSSFVQSCCKKCSVFHLTPVVIWAYFSAVMYMMIQHILLQFL